MGIGIPTIYRPTVFSAHTRAGGDSAAVINQAFNFDGVDEYLQGDAANNDLGSGDMSAGAWVNLASPSGTVVVMGNMFNDGYRVLIRSTGYYRVLIGNGTGAGYKNYEYQTDVATSSWVHLGFTFESDVTDGTLTMYVNGSSVTVAQLSDASFGSVSEDGIFAVGAAHTGTSPDVFGNHFPGKIAGVFGTSTLWTAADFSEMHGGGTDGAIRPTEHTKAAELVYSYDGMVDGDDLTDSSGTVQNASDGAGADLNPKNTEAGDLVAFP